ncbi:hypothetical protein BMS3Abin02_01760 [bacterium BMS3Abin02]|nr:hypothetical protein BMS3Abin02_01760 [bacterium BMS3Abin02]GBE22519.1 hypothetical protein BMS3Bbin01_01894 [bacterium BMS3Bbin01]HDH26238.1 hypothetical protein [Actinomycetota bacterium]HDK45120.1 hypothetical protein [Actinomycetota bacterium]HDL50105.1 hypothetical protein [Actinomycetota bacterium]
MRGKPILGFIAGLFFGFFVALLLQQFGIAPLTTTTLIGLPIAGIVLGMLLAAWAPFGRRR